MKIITVINKKSRTKKTTVAVKISRGITQEN
jgi:hypothetical protein